MQNYTYTQKMISAHIKIFSNQTFTFISSKLVYFKKHLTYQILAPLGNEPLPLNVSYCRQTNKLAGTMEQW